MPFSCNDNASWIKLFRLSRLPNLFSGCDLGVAQSPYLAHSALLRAGLAAQGRILFAHLYGRAEARALTFVWLVDAIRGSETYRDAQRAKRQMIRVNLRRKGFAFDPADTYLGRFAITR